jgi:hypothetical protein
MTTVNSLKNKFKTVSVDIVLASGGVVKYAKKFGIDTTKKRISGGIRLSKSETLRALEQLKNDK